MESKIHSTIVITSSTIILAFVFLIVIAGISTTFVNINAQGGGANQTMQQQDPQQSANQTMEKAIQSANETGQDVKQTTGEVGSKITEGAKDLVGNIGDKLQDLGK